MYIYSFIYSFNLYISVISYFSTLKLFILVAKANIYILFYYFTILVV